MLRSPRGNSVEMCLLVWLPPFFFPLFSSFALQTT